MIIDQVYHAIIIYNKLSLFGLIKQVAKSYGIPLIFVMKNLLVPLREKSLCLFFVYHYEKCHLLLNYNIIYNTVRFHFRKRHHGMDCTWCHRHTKWLVWDCRVKGRKLSCSCSCNLHRHGDRYNTNVQTDLQHG